MLPTENKIASKSRLNHAPVPEASTAFLGSDVRLIPEIVNISRKNSCLLFTTLFIKLHPFIFLIKASSTGHTVFIPVLNISSDFRFIHNTILIKTQKKKAKAFFCVY